MLVVVSLIAIAIAMACALPLLGKAVDAVYMSIETVNTMGTKEARRALRWARVVQFTVNFPSLAVMLPTLVLAIYWGETAGYAEPAMWQCVALFAAMLIPAYAALLIRLTPWYRKTTNYKSIDDMDNALLSAKRLEAIRRVAFQSRLESSFMPGDGPAIWRRIPRQN